MRESAAASIIAAQLWSYVHGFIALELAGHFAQFADGFKSVLVPLGINMVVALGDSREQAEISIAAALQPIKATRRRARSAG